MSKVYKIGDDVEVTIMSDIFIIRKPNDFPHILTKDEVEDLIDIYTEALEDE